MYMLLTVALKTTSYMNILGTHDDALVYGIFVILPLIIP